MTQTPDPREDALALLAEVDSGLKECWPCIHISTQLRERIQAALSAPPSQSESDDEKLVEAMANEFVGHIAAGRSSHVAMRFTLAVARKALTPSPTPYVRPAAEIRAEIEREERDRQRHQMTAYAEGYRAGLIFALAPPTQEPRADTSQAVSAVSFRTAREIERARLQEKRALISRRPSQTETT